MQTLSYAMQLADKGLKKASSGKIVIVVLWA